MSSLVQGLPPTNSIQDQQVRAFCDALVSAWELRNGNTGHNDNQRFITKEEYDQLAQHPLIQILTEPGRRTPGSPAEPGQPSYPGYPGATHLGVSDLSPTAQALLLMLQTPNFLIDMTRFFNSGWFINNGYAGIGINNQYQLQLTSNSALVSAINTIWAYIASTSALVQDGATVSVNPSAGTANKWTQVQTAVIDANGNDKVAILRNDYTAYVNAATALANAAWTLRITVHANGLRTIGGFGLYVDGMAGKSAFVVEADSFTIASSNGGVTRIPFMVDELGIVRSNVQFIYDYIRSNSYVPGQAGWIIKANGDAEFNGLVSYGSIKSGSKLIDKDSGYDMSSVAVGTYAAALVSGATWHTSSKLMFYGPNYHHLTDVYHRIRATSNGIKLAFLFTLSGTVDHALSLWYRKNGGAWQELPILDETPSADGITFIEPQDDYGYISATVSGLLSVGVGDYFQFGFSPTDFSLQGSWSGKVDVKFFSASVNFFNI